MKRTILAIGIACLFTMPIMAQNLFQKVDENHYLELAYYSVKPNMKDTFIELQKSTFASLRKQPGLVAIYSYNDLTRKNIYVDLVIWETLDQAKNAESNFTTLKEFEAYNKSLEKVIYYDHGRLVSDGQMAKRTISKNSVMEFVAYSIQDGKFSDYEASREGVFEFLSTQYEGFQFVQTWRSVENPKMAIDVVFWKDVETAKRAFAESAKQPVFEPFNNTIHEIKYYGDFQKVF